MSRFLWKYYLEDDAESFCQLLEESASSTRTKPLTPAQSALKIGSPSTFADSLAGTPRSYDDHSQQASTRSNKARFADIVLTRADVNRKDGKGMTLLHYAASSMTENARTFALALIAHPLIDLYIPDLENGWTALHRSFYFGNVTIARAILERESQDKLGKLQGGSATQDLRLIKVKDHEGNGPFDVLAATIKDRTLHHQDMGAQFPGFETDGDYEQDQEPSDDGRTDAIPDSTSGPVNLEGDELFTFGSNKNITLGLGNEDDRQFPERVSLKRPEHLYRRCLKEHFEHHASLVAEACPRYAELILQTSKSYHEAVNMPMFLRSKPIVIRDVQMSKYHSAILTEDPVCNLHVCGHGPGGRLGTGNEKTQFSFICIEDAVLSRRKIVSIALGQDHTLAVTDEGELFTWGSNSLGQLGTGMSRMSLNAEEPIQLLPKQIFGSLKREFLLGVAASRIHSVAHTSTALYTFGKNEGQLGIVDANAGTLEIQSTPRRVAASRFSCKIQSVSANERATVCLLENHEVHVFANYGAVKLQFPLDGFSNYHLKDTMRSTRYDDKPNTIVKITCGGDTICALSSSGEIFAVSVNQTVDPASSGSASTTHPNKIRAALSAPARVWTLKKGHMNARDVGVDQDGSIVLTTEAGSVWRRVRRTNLPGPRPRGAMEKKSKDFKFSRVPGLTRIIAVRASASGAYSAIRRDCDVTRTQIIVKKRSLPSDVGALLPFRNIDSIEPTMSAPAATFWTRPTPLQKISACLSGSKDLEEDIKRILSEKSNTYCANYDASIGSTVSDVRIPVHSFILACRSRIIRAAIRAYRQESRWENDVLSISVDKQGRLLCLFKGLDFLSLVELTLYLYTDEVVGFWLRTRIAPELAFRYRQVRVELMKIANRLELRNLESTARKMTATSPPCMHFDFEMALMDPEYLQSGDAMLQLKDGEILVHSDLLSRRCPFFEGLFQGRAGGRWLTDRHDLLSDSSDKIVIDFTHVEVSTFRLVLRHLYADAGEELFDEVVTEDVDEFLDLVLDVLSVANELMLDRLSQICQSVLGRHVNVRNACGLLNAVAPSAVSEFKNSALEYTCLNLETMLTSQSLDELEDDLLHELDQVVRDNQLSTMPFAKSGRAEAELLERYPELAARIDRDRQAKLDSLNLQMKYIDHQGAFGTPLNADDEDFQSRVKQQRRRKSGNPWSPKINAMEPLSEAGLSADLGHDLSITGTSPLPPTPSSYKYSGTLDSQRSPAITPGSLGRSPDVGSGAEQFEQEFSSAQNRSWDKTPLTPAKLGMREIMDQAASSRTSGISLGLASQAKADTRFAGNFNSRMSQKERRRLLQQEQEQHATTGDAMRDKSISASSSTPTSPWQTVSRAKPSPVVESQNLAVRQSTSASPADRRPTPQLTLRQTVANVSSSPRSNGKNFQQPPQTPKANRSVSSPLVSSSPSPRPTPSSHASSGTKPIEIQSIRHAPRPDAQISPTFFMHQSMADILSQQEAEKTVVKEAVAKRSLQEIQQEQEFLTWWDAESKRVADEEAANARAAAGSGKSKGGGTNSRRGRSRPSRGRGRAKDAANPSAAA